ncbi:heparan-alpha-glucosaminide N-acetyltransferase-like [Anneissia japonica]|uniref:heparan-alpha-glucosaminide N-acetyltransferase-like n=1 Tax=Anneissia japonica TaxID=1529436 RepID=UPI00142599FD|nr:heparan-alpha-glucosaminide N-acetyltransferase-like [Anneissia japonica]
MALRCTVHFTTSGGASTCLPLQLQQLSPSLWAKKLGPTNTFRFSGCIATILCKGTKNDGWIPINKNLWSISFVLALSSMAFLLLIFCYWTIDVVHWWSGAPFFYAGMNSIFLYIGHEVFSGYFPFSWKPFVGNHAEYLAMSLIGASIWVLIAFYLFKVNFFLKI